MGTTTAGRNEKPVRTVFMGTPAFALPVLEALLAAGETEVVAVYTPPDRPRGRGRTMETTPVKAAAQERGLPLFQPASLRPAPAQEELASLQPDLIVVAAYGKLLPPPVLALPPHGCLNLHPSLLPRYRGPSPVVSAILDGAPQTGVSLMFLDEGMDTGPVVAQEERGLRGDETADALTDELFRRGAELLRASLDGWVSGALTAAPQDEAQATITRKLERADGWADWNLPAVELERRRRAFTPWPGLSAHWQDKSLRLLDVAPLEPPPGPGSEPNPEPGRVVALPLADTPVGVATGQGILGLKQVQLEGRRAVAAADFLRGYPAFIGSQL